VERTPFLTGEYRHALDDRGRIAVPVRFRARLSEGATLTRWLDACLAVFPRDAWAELAEKLRGLPLTSTDIAKAEKLRGALYHRVAAFLRGYDLLLCPAACVPPFDVKTRWVREVNGVAFDTYVEWLRLAYAITLTSCPTLSLPCGFTGDGLPIGMQVIGRSFDEATVLRLADAYQRVTDWHTRRPPLGA